MMTYEKLLELARTIDWSKIEVRREQPLDEQQRARILKQLKHMGKQ